MGNHVVYYGGSFDSSLDKGFRKVDADIVKIDLLNHLFTRKGERPMMPTFGTSLQDLLFEPINALMKSRIANEVQTVIDYDPRVELLNISVIVDEDANSIKVVCLVQFIELDIIDTINLDLNLPT